MPERAQSNRSAPARCRQTRRSSAATKMLHLEFRMRVAYFYSPPMKSWRLTHCATIMPALSENFIQESRHEMLSRRFPRHFPRNYKRVCADHESTGQRRYVEDLSGCSDS